MAFPLTVAQCVFRWDLNNGQEGINVLHFGVFGGADFDTPDCQAVAESVHDWYSNPNFKTETNNALRFYIDSNVILREIIVSDVGPGPSVQFTETVNEAGAVASTPLPIESSVVTTWRTLTPGRSGRGRTFWPGFTVTALDDAGGLGGVVQGTFTTTCQALIDGFGIEADYFPSVFSRLTSVNHIMTSATVQSVIHHQRRRNS